MTGPKLQPAIRGKLYVFLGIMILGTAYAQTETLVRMSSFWKYLDDGSDQGSAWTATDFNDLHWAISPAPLGYGNGNEATVVNYGSNRYDKFITTYFRHQFTVVDPIRFSSLSLGLLRDDGIVVYLNGVEFLRDNMPSGPIAFDTPAAGRPPEGDFVYIDGIPSGTLVAGQNTIAAEIHQRNRGSSDIAFDLELKGTGDSGFSDPEPVTILSVDPEPGSIDQLARIRVTFNRSVWGVDATDLLVNGIGAMAVEGEGEDYTFTVSPPREGTVRVTWLGSHGILGSGTPHQAFDVYGEGASWQYEHVDSVTPTVLERSPVADATLRSLSEISITFSEAVTGVDADDLLVADVPAGSVRGSGAGPYRFEFTALGDGLVEFVWAPDHGITDLAGVPNAFTADNWQYQVQSNTSHSDIIISEIMYHPASGRTEDEYIELWNIGTETVNLTGWSFDRGVDFCFPNINLNAGDRLVIAADLDMFGRKYPGVTNVIGNWQGRLSNSQEDIELEDAAGDRVDIVHYADEGDWAIRQRGPLDRGHRGWIWFSSADGGGRSLELQNPALSNNQGQNWSPSLYHEGTPGELNSVHNHDIAPMILDVNHTPLVPHPMDTVTITARIVDEQPTWQSLVTLYVRDASLVPPPDFTGRVLFDDGAHNDGTSRDGIFGVELSAMPHGTVLEFYIEAVDPAGQIRTWPGPVRDIGGAVVQSANALLQVDNSVYLGSQPVYRLIMTESERRELQFINRSSNAQMNGTLITEEAGRSKLRHNVGIRIRGAGSRSRTPTNHRVNIPTDRPWNGVNELNLNTQFTHAQLIGSILSQKSGLPSADARAVQIRINGENPARNDTPQYGSYVLTEVVNGDWAQNHYPIDGNGNTYACRRPNTNLSYLGTDPNRYLNAGYHKTSHASENDWSDLIQLTEVLNHAADATYIEEVHQVAHVEKWMTYFAVISLLAYGETALGTGVGDDYNMYSGVEDPRFLLLPHDLDTILGQGDGSVRPFNSDIYDMERIPVIRRLFDVPVFRSLYHQELRRLLAGPFAAEHFDPLIDQVLGSWVPSSIIGNMKLFAAARHQHVSSILPPLQDDAVKVTISGEPPTLTYITGATLHVAGENITHYRYRLNGDDYSDERLVTQKIHLEGLSNGTYTVAVVGKNSEGTWQDEIKATLSTTWTVDTSQAVIKINEILAKNDTAVSHGGTYPDLIELYNAGDTPMDLAGWFISDNPDRPYKYSFPPETSLGPGGYLVLYANDLDGTNGLHLGFSLRQSSEGVYLFAPNGDIIDAVDFGPQLADRSIGRLADGRWTLTVPTFGAENQAAGVGRKRSVRINEWLPNSNRDYPDDFIELYNPNALPVNLGGLILTDNPIGVPNRHQIQALSFIPAFGYRTYYADGQPKNGAEHLDFKLAAEQGMIGLLDVDQTTIDCVTYTPMAPGEAQGRAPDGADTIAILREPSPNQENHATTAPVWPLLLEPLSK